jgi:hypothetical protein
MSTSASGRISRALTRRSVKYIQRPERREPLSGPYQDREILAVYRQDFEFKIRERVMLKTILDRKGALEFPQPDLV